MELHVKKHADAITGLIGKMYVEDLVMSDFGVGTVSDTVCDQGIVWEGRSLFSAGLRLSQMDESSRVKIYLKAHQLNLNPEPGGILGKDRKFNCPKSLQPESSNILQRGNTEGPSSKPFDWTSFRSTVALWESLLTEKKEEDYRMFPPMKDSNGAEENNLASSRSASAVLKEATLQSTHTSNSPPANGCERNAHHLQRQLGKLLSSVFSISDAGACPSVS